MNTGLFQDLYRACYRTLCKTATLASRGASLVTSSLRHTTNYQTCEEHRLCSHCSSADCGQHFDLMCGQSREFPLSLDSSRQTISCVLKCFLMGPSHDEDSQQFTLCPGWNYVAGENCGPSSSSVWGAKILCTKIVSLQRYNWTLSETPCPWIPYNQRFPSE